MESMTLRLFGTPRSHFTRIVRIVGLELGVPLESVDVGNVGRAEAFGGNPLMKVPALVDGAISIWGSANICRYLVQKAGRDPLRVCALDWAQTDLVYVIEGVMSAGVQLILAARAGLEPQGGPFDKVRATIVAGLGFIDQHLVAGSALDYTHVCAVAMWDHLLLYELASVEQGPAVDAIARRFAERPSIAGTRPS